MIHTQAYQSLNFSLLISLLLLLGCAVERNHSSISSSSNKVFTSEQYNHFEGGVLFAEYDFGLAVLWNASFRYGRVYRENLGLFLTQGLLILPNKYNTPYSSTFQETHLFEKDSSLYVIHQGRELQVLGIIHTHPDKAGIQTPSPTNDYQFSYLGIHNYILSSHNVYDAYLNDFGQQEFQRMGSRNTVSLFQLFKPFQPMYSLVEY